MLVVKSSKRRLARVLLAQVWAETMQGLSNQMHHLDPGTIYLEIIRGRQGLRLKLPAEDDFVL